MKETETYSYAPWQLQELRRQLRAGFAEPDKAAERAAKMAGLSMKTVRLLMENDNGCKAILAGRKGQPKQQVQPAPTPPKGVA